MTTVEIRDDRGRFRPGVDCRFPPQRHWPRQPLADLMRSKGVGPGYDQRHSTGTGLKTLVADNVRRAWYRTWEPTEWVVEAICDALNVHPSEIYPTWFDVYCNDDGEMEE